MRSGHGVATTIPSRTLGRDHDKARGFSAGRALVTVLRLPNKPLALWDEILTMNEDQRWTRSRSLPRPALLVSRASRSTAEPLWFCGGRCLGGCCAIVAACLSSREGARRTRSRPRSDQYCSCRATHAVQLARPRVGMPRCRGVKFTLYGAHKGGPPSRGDPVVRSNKTHSVAGLFCCV
jgi:hypothetical protein